MMKFGVVFKIDETEMIKLEWDVPSDEDGHVFPEESDMMMVFEREDVSEDVMWQLRKYMQFMVNAYVEGVENEGEYTDDAKDEG